MKRFLYVEQTEGGMIERIVTDSSELSGLFGWMRESCKADDVVLVDWMRAAEIGEYHEHRLGIVVRLKDKQ